MQNPIRAAKNITVKQIPSFEGFPLQLFKYIRTTWVASELQTKLSFSQLK
jgi:hypothetical protein